MDTLTFRTMEQAVLWEHELCGQISDGAWENLMVRDHWQCWCNAEIEVGSKVGRNFWARYDKYNFVAKNLLEIIGPRMIAKVRLVRLFGANVIDIFHWLIDEDTGGYKGEPKCAGEYFDKVRTRIMDALEGMGKTLVDVENVLNDPNGYSKKDLLADLREIKKTIKIQR